MAIGTIVRVWQETPRLHGVAVDVDFGDTHARPGQYVKVEVGQHATDASSKQVIPLALATAPGVRPVELLFDASARPQVAAGERIDLGSPEGRGFDLDSFAGLDILVFAVGSAMSAARAVLDAITARRAEFGRVTFFYGARSELEHAYRERDPLWTAARIDVRRSTDLDWVQDRFRAAPVPLENAVALVVGLPEMERAVREVLVAHGLRADRIFSNF
ncbi:MAG: hypothetical protein HY791_38625 [Deltaproteobacteria bacterium]|nr:hypothetical protein [Deltaproteobacteria bacterium]